jgi:hypothetical protein
MTMTDTSPEARAKQDEILRAMSGEQRMTHNRGGGINQDLEPFQGVHLGLTGRQLLP